VPPTEQQVSVGYVRRAHGIRGEVIVRPLTDNPDRYRAGSRVLTDEEQPRSLEVLGVRTHKDGLIVAFSGVTDRNAAERLQGVTLMIARDSRRSLEAGEYWPDDLEGLTVIDPDGRHLGKIAGVVLGEAQDRIVVATEDGSSVEVPFVDQFFGEIHPSGGYIVADPPEGLF
jgi:16S rRNA processing protein RimM